MAKFRELAIGQTFDWVNPDRVGYNSYFKRCIKTGARSYEDVSNGDKMRVGSINAAVFHVDEMN